MASQKTLKVAAEPRARPTPKRSWSQGWWSGARHCVSPNEGPRPVGASIDLVVVHSISLPPGIFGGPHIESLFTNTLNHEAHPYFASLQGLTVSAHFLIRRRGELVQFVSCDRRAWHAGTSSWQGRSNCNDFSIGIELEGLEGLRFTAAQYRRLVDLLALLRGRYRLQFVAGHEHVAPGRKADPGPGFDWPRLGQKLALKHTTASLVLPHISSTAASR
jgi:N-acetyl-anhydromuramoyl-L-alanine amidase